MVKVFKLNSPFSFLILLALLGILFFIGLPLMLAAAAGLFVLGALRKLLLGSTQSRSAPLSREEDSLISPVIHNEKIGPYRVIENPNDPNVIEVEKL